MERAGIIQQTKVNGTNGDIGIASIVLYLNLQGEEIPATFIKCVVEMKTIGRILKNEK